MPERVGKYTILGTIGSGTSGTVFLAMDPDLGRQVAVKQLSPQLAADPGFLDRFRHEAAVMARLTHPNCVQVYDFLEERAGAYIISEYVAGASLRRVLEDHGRLAPEQALAVTRGALSGLAFAHELGLVHRDVKPENLLADLAGVSKLADFGQATFTGELAGGARQTSGSPAYMSPEQVRGESGDVRSDVYAAGAVMFEFLAGRPPFVALSRLAVMKMQLERQPPDLSRVNPRVPARLTAVVNQALAKEARDRYSSAGEFQAVLEEVARDSYGAGWLEAGSITALVAAAAGAAAASGAAAAAPTPATAQAGSVEVGQVPAPAPAPTPTVQPLPTAISPSPAPVTAPVGAPIGAPGPTRRGPGIAAGLAAAVAGLLVGGALTVAVPPSSLGLLPAAAVSTPAPSPTPIPAPPAATLQSISARFDNSVGTTFYDVSGAPAGATYTWGWINKPVCGALEADPGGLTAAFRHQGCDPVGEGRAVVGVCIASGQGSAVYQRNARFGDGAFTAQEAAAAGAAGDQFSQVDSSPAADICSGRFGQPVAAAITPVPGALSPAPSPTPTASPSIASPSPATTTPSRRELAGLGAGVAVGLLVALLGILLLRRGVSRP